MRLKNSVESLFLKRIDKFTLWWEECQTHWLLQVNLDLFLESNLKSEKDTFKVDYARGDKDI